MPVDSSELRADLYRLDSLVPHPGFLAGDPEDVVETDWSAYWSPEPN